MQLNTDKLNSVSAGKAIESAFHFMSANETEPAEVQLAAAANWLLLLARKNRIDVRQVLNTADRMQQDIIKTRPDLYRAITGFIDGEL